MIFFQN